MIIALNNCSDLLAVAPGIIFLEQCFSIGSGWCIDSWLIYWFLYQRVYEIHEDLVCLWKYLIFSLILKVHDVFFDLVYLGGVFLFRGLRNERSVSANGLSRKRGRGCGWLGEKRFPRALWWLSNDQPTGWFGIQIELRRRVYFCLLLREGWSPSVFLLICPAFYQRMLSSSWVTFSFQRLSPSQNESPLVVEKTSGSE